MNLKEFKSLANRLLKKEEYNRYLPAFPTIPINCRETFFVLLMQYPIDKTLQIIGADLPPKVHCVVF